MARLIVCTCRISHTVLTIRNLFAELFIQHAVSMRCILPSVPSQSVPYFSILSHKDYHFQKVVADYTLCVVIFCTTLPERFLILRIIQHAPVILVRFEWNLNFLDKNIKRKQTKKVIEISYSGIRFVLCPKEDRQTEMTKVIVAFRNFENALRNGCINLHTNSSDVRLFWAAFY
jgi:hypothetical protein